MEQQDGQIYDTPMNPSVAIVRLTDVPSKKGFQQSTARISPPTAQYTTISENHVQVAYFIGTDKRITHIS